jgi:hypothetical protein
MNNIYSIEYIEKRAALTSKLTKIDIYQGFVNPGIKGSAMKIQEIRPLEPGNFGNVWEFFKNTTFGDFTAVFYPSKEIIYFSNKPVLNGSENLNGIEAMNYIPTEDQVNAQVQRILEIERLKNKVQELEDEKENSDVWGRKMGAALNMIIERWVGVPGGSVTEIETEPVLNGSDNLNESERALAIIVSAFGEEWVKKFAAKIQNEPHLVNQIKNFFS